MKRFLRKKKTSRILAAILACIMLVTTIGSNSIVAKAAISASMFTKETGASVFEGESITIQDGENGVEVIDDSTENANLASHTITTTSTYNVYDKGLHLEVTDIKGRDAVGSGDTLISGLRDDYTFLVHLGTLTHSFYTSLNYADTCIIMAIGSNGCYKIWHNKTSDFDANPTISSDHLIAYGVLNDGYTPADNDHALTLDVKVEERNYCIVVNGQTISFADNGWLTQSQLQAAKVGLHVWAPMDSTTYACVYDGNQNPFNVNYTPAGSSYVITELSETVSVKPYVTLDQALINMQIGEEETLIATPYPTNVKVNKWASDNESVATVVDGVVTAKAEGTATITATADNGTTASCKVHVYEDVPAGVVDESYLEIKNNKSGTGVTLQEVSNGVQIQHPSDEWLQYVSTTHRHSLERGILYRFTDIKKMDATASGGYSIAMSIGNNANGQQWYDKAGYMILYGESGNFAILKTLGGGLWATGNGTTGYEKVEAAKLDSLDGELSIYVKEVDNDWQVIVNDKYEYTLPDATEYLGGAGARQWFSVGAMSDFDATSNENDPTLGLNYLNTATDNPKCGVSFTVSNIAPTVPTVFTDGMLFQQEKAMNVWGYGIPGQTITAKLYKGEEVLETQTSTVISTGRWDVSFGSYGGSYDSYKIEISVGNNIQQVIKDVLIGELWISGGQSNMEWEVKNDWNKETLLAQAEDENSEYLRVFLEPTYPLGVESGRKYPAIDIPNAYWGYGNVENDIGAMSSVAYTFAKELQEKLDMPIGIVNTAIGGTCIEGWLSREAIESEPELVEKLSQYDNDTNEEAYMSSSQMYYAIEDWDTVTSSGTSAVGESQAYVMTSLYNQKIGPLEGMNVAGTIWWQGSSNITSSEYYDEELDLLKRCWGETFGYGNGDMPFIFTQVTPYEQGYGSYMEYSVLGYLAEAMEQAWKLSEDNNTAMLTVYDQPLDFIWKEYETEVIPDDMVNRLHPVHTRNKGGIGERFALSAWNMVYDGTEEYTAPVYDSVSIQGNEIYITFDRVGAGLKTIDGTTNVHGFTIAGKDGVYVNAEAEIVDSNTVKVWNEFVSNPKNIMYAFSDLNQGSNLCSSVGIPAAPFRTVVVDDNVKNQDPNTTLFVAQDWMYADKDVWLYHGGIAKADSPLYQAYVNAGYQTNADKLADAHYNFDNYPSFAVAGGADTYSYDSAVKAEGTASLKVEYDSDFTVSPILTYQSIKILDWSKFDYLSVSIRNAASVELAMTINGVTIPTLDGATSAQHSGSTEFKVVTFDLSKVSESDRAKFSEVNEMTFSVTGNGTGTMYFDKFMVGRNTVTGVEIEKESLLMIPGETEVLATTLSTTGTLTWSSENEAVATVDSSTGLITAVKEGRTTITATVGDYEATCDVWVRTKTDVNNWESAHVLPISNDTMHNVQECITGYKVDYQIGAADWHRMNYTKNLYISSTAGTRVEIENIETETEKYSIGVWFGNDNTGWNTVDGYMLLCKNDGEFVIVESKATTGVNGSGVLAQGDIGVQSDALSINIQYDTDGTTLIVKVNGVTCSFVPTKTISKFAIGAMGDFTINSESNTLSYTSLNLASSPLQYCITYLGWSGNIDGLVAKMDYTNVYDYCQAKKVAPVKGGYVFAGWYLQENTYNAKFVPKDVLTVKGQLKLVEGTTDSETGKADLRLVTTVDDSLDYAEVGFIVTSGNNSRTYKQTTAYTSLLAAGFTKTPDVFNACSKKFITVNLTGLVWNATDKLVDRTIIVQAYWKTHDGTLVYGTARRITIQQGLDAINNITNVVNE